MTTAKNARRYVASPGSLAFRVLEFLVNNPDEELTFDDLLIKFDAHAGSVANQLRRAQDIGAITRQKNTYKLLNLALATDAIGGDGQSVRDRACLQAQHAVATMTASAHRSPPPASIDSASSDEWNAAAAAMASLPSVVLEGQTIRLEHAPFYKYTRAVTGRFRPIFDALEQAVPCRGMTVRCVLPEQMRWKSAASALHRWHRQRGYAKPVIQLVRIKTGASTQTVLQRIPPTA